MCDIYCAVSDEVVWQCGYGEVENLLQLCALIISDEKQ